MVIKHIMIALCIHSVVCASDDGFRCDYTYFDEAYGWFKLHRFPTYWLDAKLRCSLEGARLASPTDKTFESMKLILENSTVEKVFTGINSIFRRGYFNTLEGIPAEHCSVLQQWDIGEPNNVDDMERCVSLSSRGYLADVSCDKLMLPFICYKKKTGRETMNRCGTTDEEYEYNSDTKTCHKLHTEGRQFYEAFMTCQAEGGYLAIIDSDEEKEVINDLINRHPSANIKGSHYKESFYIGYHDDWFKGQQFMSLQDQPMSETAAKFGRGQPDNQRYEHCVSIYRGSPGIHDLNCGTVLGFVCEIDPSIFKTC